jgi:ribosomal protein L2
MFVNYIIKKIKKKNKNGYITSSGRNFAGIICVQHKGGGLKKNVYNIDFFRRLNNYGIVFKIFKVSFYSSFIGLILYQNGLSSYILLSNNVIIGDLIYSGTLLKKENKKEKILLGFALPLFYMNLLSMIHNIELYPFSGSSLMRAAGTSTFITTKYKHKVSLKLKSG